MPRQFFVLRHGRSRANERGLIASSMANAGERYGLTTEGRQQVRETIGGTLEDLSEPLAVVSSPLLRARETAEIVAGLVGATVEVDDRLIERAFGELEMLSDERYDSVWEVDRQDPTQRRWGVESVELVWSRVQSLMHERYRGSAAGTLILVTHGDVASALICGSRGAPLSRHREVGELATGQMRSFDWPPAADPPIFDDDP